MPSSSNFCCDPLNRSIRSFNQSIGGERQQRDVPRALDCQRHLTLMLCAVARDATRQNFSALGDEPTKFRRIFIVNVLDLVDAERANFSPRAPSSLSSDQIIRVSFPSKIKTEYPLRRRDHHYRAPTIFCRSARHNRHRSDARPSSPQIRSHWRSLR